MKNFIPKWAQKIFILFVVKPFYRLFFKFKVIGIDSIKGLSGPLLIIGNHKTFCDSLAVAAAVPITSKLHPCETMGVYSFKDPVLVFLQKIGVISFIYYVCSVFPAIRGKGLEIALKKPVEILKNNGIVLIHPEGGIIKGDKIGQFKRGAPMLALNTRTRVSPVVFKANKIGFREKYYIKFGPSFFLPTNLSVEEGADYMRKIIADLYKTLP